MIELECPWCQEACRLEMDTEVLRCDGCGAEAEIADPAPRALANAA